MNYFAQPDSESRVLRVDFAKNANDLSDLHRLTTAEPRLGVGMTHFVVSAELYVHGFLRCGESYSVHPAHCIDRSGQVVPLPTTRGLRRSRFSEFEWEVESHRRRLVVKQAEIDFVEWADAHVGGRL